MDNEFETGRLLHAVDALDELRGLLSDIEEGHGTIPRPPAMRDHLLKLHQMVFNDGYEVARDELCKAALLLDDINMEVFEIIQQAEKIRSILRDLQESLPEFDDEEYEKASEEMFD